ncbi:N-acetylmuramoyl-L-alanine amidase [Lysinibacillus sp. NPDC097162]|uniref:N-acetylmuramoyl-L-alanine amidase n=1 Tax=Lysinibacillus sp. NPDC097162 TaxID=3364140 RepID=UPI0037F2D4BC
MTKAIVISSGHGQYVRGAKHYIDEVDEARRVVDTVAKYLRERGATVYVYHDDTSRTQRDNLNAIVAYHNSKQRSLDVSVHFNAAGVTDAPRGCEVLYYDAKQAAANVSKAIAVAGCFKDRGPKERRDLAFTSRTNMPALLLEVCFVDSKADIELYQRNFDAICVAIAVSLAKEAGIVLNVPSQPSPPQKEESNIMPRLLNATGREEAKELIKKAVACGVFQQSHLAKLDTYDDVQLISYSIAYVNRTSK